MTPEKKEEVPLSSSQEYTGLMDLLMQGRNSKAAKQLSIAGGESLQLLNQINNMQPTRSGSAGTLSDGMAQMRNPFSSKESVDVNGLLLRMKKEVEKQQSQVNGLRGGVGNMGQQYQVSALQREGNYQPQWNTLQRETNHQPQWNALQRETNNPMHSTALQRESNNPLQQLQMNPQQPLLNSVPFDAREHVQPLRPRFRNSLQPRFSGINLWGSQPSAHNGDAFRGKSFDFCVAFSFPPSANRNETDMKRMLRGLQALGPAVLPILLDTGDAVLPCSHEFLCGTKLSVNRHGVLYVRRMMAQIEAILTQYQISCSFLSIANPGVFFGMEVLDVLKLVRKLVRGGYLSEQVLLVGRDVDVQNQPDFDQYASSMKRLYETTPFNSPFSMVETPS